MRMEQGSPASATGGSSPTRMESTTALPQSPPTQAEGMAPKSGAEPIIIWKEGAMEVDTPVLTPNGTSVPGKMERPRAQARRRGAFIFEDTTPRSEFEEFEVITATEPRFADVASKIEGFRIPLQPHRPLGSPLSSSSSSILISAEELASDLNGATKLVEMKCFICGASLQLPSYAALQKKCHLKCSNCETGETHAKNWMDIILTALYNLEILHQRQYFHCKSEICAFIDHHWSSICPERARTPTWGNTVMSQISTHPELFQSHQRGSGYWALKRSSPQDREASRSKDGEGEKDVRGGDKRAENKNKRRSDLKVLGEEDDENQEYFIEEILSKRIRKGSVEYFVKWEGLADVENSWEKAQDIECSELVQDFESEARKNPLWKEGSGLCLKRKREELDEKSEKKARRLSKKQMRIPVSQWCHQCLRHKPVIMCCDGVATGKCGMQYCERCLEKHYDEEIVVLQKAKGEWLCPRCRGICSCVACDPEKSKVKKQQQEGKAKRSDKEPVISRIIARCKIEGTNEWEYLVHYKGRAESENRWVRSSQMDLPPHLKKRYRNTLKMRVTKKNTREPPTPEPRSSNISKTGTPGGRTRTPKGLRTSDFDISRVVFDDQVHRIVVPEKPEVATPAWRVVTDSPAAGPNGAASLYSEKRESNGDSIATIKVAGVVEIDADTLLSLRELPDEGSSSEDTSDEAFMRRHSRYETVYNASEPKARRRGSMTSRKSTGNKNNKGGRREDEHSTPTLRQSRDRRNSRVGVERRRSDSQLVHYGSDDLAIPDVMRVDLQDETSASMDQMDVVPSSEAIPSSSAASSSASVPPTPTPATPLTEISAT